MGQGINTKVAMAVVHGINFFLADAAISKKVRVQISDVHIAEANSAYIANAGLTGGSSGSEACCHVANEACKELGKRLAPVLRSNPDVESWRELIAAAAKAQVHLQVLQEHNVAQTAFNYFVFASAMSLIELDTLTGAHQVIHTEIVYDSQLHTKHSSISHAQLLASCSASHSRYCFCSPSFFPYRRRCPSESDHRYRSDRRRIRDGPRSLHQRGNQRRSTHWGTAHEGIMVRI